MEFSRPEYWNGEPLPSTGGLPNPGIKPRSPTLQVDSLPAEPQEKAIYSKYKINLQESELHCDMEVLTINKGRK